MMSKRRQASTASAIVMALSALNPAAEAGLGAGVRRRDLGGSEDNRVEASSQLRRSAPNDRRAARNHDLVTKLLPRNHPEGTASRKISMPGSRR